MSQSSTNYGRGAGESAYRDLISWLLGLRSDFAEARTYGFAERIAEVDEDVFARAARGEVNPCGDCGFRESRLDDVLDRLAARESTAELNVVVTDLWLANSDLIGSGRLALQNPIRDILADGRAIGLLGVDAPYSGQVFDVPGGALGSTIPAGLVERRPVFAILVGHPGQVAALQRRVAAEVFPQGTAAQAHFTLFTPNLVATGPVEHRLAPRSRAARRAYILRVEGANVPGFMIDRRAAGRRAADRRAEDGAGVRWDLAAPLSGTGNEALPPAGYDLVFGAWTLVARGRSGACDENAWAPLEIEGALQVTADSVGLDASHSDLLAVRAGDIAFIRYRLVVGAFERGRAGVAWLDQWSFDADGAPALMANPPPLFPTLNLAAFGRILQTAMRERVLGQTVAQGSLFVSVE